MKIVKILLVMLLVFFSWSGFVSGTGLVRTSSNTLLFTEDFDDTTYIDSSSYYSYTFRNTGGYVSQQYHITWDWDGPLADIEYSKDGSGVYIIYEKYNDVPEDGYGMRPDVFLYKIDENGTALWSRSVWVRRKTNVEWSGSRYPSLTTDDNGNVYVVWIDRETSGGRYVAMQKFNSDGVPQWNNGVEIKALTNVYTYQSPRCAYYNGYVYVVAKYNANGRLVHLQKVNATNGNLEFSNPVTVNVDTSVNVYNPDVKIGGNKIYVVWSRNFNNVYVQRLSDDGTRDFGSDVKVNTNSGYYYKYFWYGNREDDVVMDIDDNTNVFIAWSSGDINSEQQIYLQKLDKDLNRQWTNDIKVAADALENAAAYPAIAVQPDGAAVYVAWISHRSGYNDHGFLQKINGNDGSIQWASDLDMRNNYGYYHGGRIDFYNGWVYTVGVSGRFQRFNNNGDRFFNGYKIFYDRSFFVRTKYDSLTVLPGVVLQARIKEISVTKNPTGAKVLYRFAGDGNNWSSYVEPTNGEIEITLTSNVGNDFRYGALLDSKTDVDTNEWGMDRCIMYQIQVEATKLYLGDWSVSPYDTGADAVGNLVLNQSAENQNILKYVYNTGNNSTFGYFLLRNNGNVKTNFKITATGSSANWGVQYYTGTYSGGKWVTNVNITSSITNTGFFTNVVPYNNSNDELVCIIAKVTPSASLSENDSYVINLNVFAEINSSYYPHDVASMNAVVKNYKPDLHVGMLTNSGVVIDYDGDSIYNSTGDLQEKFQKADTNVTAVYYVKVENDGKLDTINVTGTAGNASWDVKYYAGFDGTTDITADITGAGHKFILNALAYTQMRVEVTPINPAIGAEYDLLVTGVSTNNTGEVDAVKITTRRVESKVDVLVKRDSDSSYTGDNIYNTNALSQSVTNVADNGMTNIFYYQVYNEGSEAMDIIVNADFNKSLTAGWDVKFYYGSQDITSQITNFYVFTNLAVGGYETIEVKIAPPLTFSAGANELMDSFLWGRSEAALYKYHKTDKNKVFTKCISSREDLIAVNSTNLYIGRNVITNSYENQNSFEFINHMITNNYQFIITNTAPSPYKVRLTKTVENDSGWLISFTHSGSNIDSYLTTGWTTPEIPAYGKEVINVLVHPTSSVSADITNKITINAVSLINSADVDVIRFSTSRIFPPDLLVKKTNQIFYGGDDEYGTNIASQASGGSISTNIIIQGNTNDYWYMVKIQNDRTLPETSVVYGTKSDTNFMISYWQYIGTNINNPDFSDNSQWNDITSEITRTTGYTLYNMNSGTNILFRVGARVTNTNIKEGDSIETIVKAVGLDAGYLDMIRLYTTYGIARPDLIIRTNWDNVYEVSNSTVQIITNIVDKATGSVIDFIIENESSLNKGTFLVKGQNDVGDWILKYYDKTSDISGQVKSGSGYTKTMNTLTSSTLQMHILVNTNSLYTNGYTYTMFISVEPEDSENLKDMGKIVTIITDKGKVDISQTNGEWNDYYETTTVSSQIYKYIEVERGYTNSFIFYIGNDRSDAEEMLRFTGDGNAGSYTVRYYVYKNSSWSNVTADSTGLGFKPHISNNSIVTMKFEVTVGTNVIVGDEQAFNVHLKSQGQLEEDNATFWVRVVDKGVPDLSFTTGAWDNVYENNNPVTQITNFTIEKGYTNTYSLYIGNDKTGDERLKLTGNGNKGDFGIRYLLVTNGFTNNITDEITNTGAHIPVAATSSELLLLKVSLLSNSDYTMASNFIINMKLYSQAESVNDAIRLVVSVTDKGIPDLGYSETNNNYKFTNVIYPTVQQTNIFVEKGISKIDYIILKNGLNWRDETFRFIGNKISSAGWQLSCYDMSYNDIPYFTNNYYTISANSSKTLMLNMLVDEDSLVSGSRTTSFTLESRGKLKKDILSLTYTITDRGDPDLVYANGMLGDGDKEPTYPPSSQVYTNLIERGETYDQILYLQNDNPDRGEKLRFTGSGTKGDFIVSYWYWTNSSWVGINTNRKIYVDNNSTATLRMRVTLAVGSTYGTNVQKNFDLNLKSMGQQVEDNMIIWYKVADKGRPNIAFTNGKWTNYVESSPIFQTTNSYVEKGYTNSFYFNLWNNRTNRSEKFSLKGNNNNVGDFSVKYFILTNATPEDITTAVLGSGFSVTVKSNDKVKMLLKIGLPANSSHPLNFTTTNFTYLYSENGYARDAIKILSIVTDYGKPDLVMDNNNFNDIYYPTSQITNIFIEKGFRFTNYIYLNNDLSSIRSYEKYNLKGGADTGDWDLSYYYLTNSIFTDVSSAVAGSSGRDFYVDANSSVTLAQVVYVPESSSYGYGENYSLTNILLSQGKLVEDRLSFVYTITSFAQPDLSVTNGLGTNVYETSTVLTQNYTNIVEKGLTNYIIFICGNDNPVRSEDLRFIGTKSGIDFSNSYYFYKNGVWTNVTSAATNQNDGFSFFVPNNSIKTMKMGIYLDMNSSYTTNSLHTFDIRLKSQGKLKQDHFIVYGKVVDRGKPDISFTNGNWDNQYDYVSDESFPPSFQYTNFYVEKGYTNKIYFDLGNDRADSHYEYMRFKAASNQNEFIVTYTTNGKDITSAVTSSTGALLYVPGAGSVRIVASVSLLSNSDNGFGTGFNINPILKSMGGAYMEKASIVVSTTDYGRPDLYTDGEFNNIYSPDSEITNIIAEKGFTITNYIYLNNDLNSIRSFERYYFKSKAGTGEWNLTYYYKTNGSFIDVTSEVTDVRKFYVPANSTYTLAAVMRVDTNCSYGVGTSLNTSMTLISQGKLVKDKMSFVYFITDTGKPDITLTNAGSVWSTTYEDNGSVNIQIFTNEIELKKTNNFYFYVENDNTVRGETLRFQGDKPGPSYNLKYYRVTSGSLIDVTSVATNPEEYDVYIPNNSKITMVAQCYIGSNSGLSTNAMFDVKLNITSQGRFKEDNAVIRYVVVDNGKPDIAFTNGAWNNKYYPTNVQQTNFYVEPMKTNVLILNLQNDKNEAEILHLKANIGNNIFNVKYFTNNVDITADITNANGYNISFAASSTQQLEINVTINTAENYSFGTNMNLIIELQSEARFKKDLITLNTYITDFGIPDCKTTNNDFNNEYYPTNQTYTIPIERGVVKTNFVVVENDNSYRNEKFLVTFDKPDTNAWNLQVYYLTNGNSVDISSSVFSNGREIEVGNNSTATLKTVMLYKITMTNIYYSNAYTLVDVDVLSAARMKKDVLTLNYAITDNGKPDISFYTGKYTNIYEWITPNSQISNYIIEKGETNEFKFVLDNDRGKDEYMSLDIDNFQADGWFINVEIYSNNVWNDVTSDATNYGAYISLPANTSMSMRMKVGVLPTNNSIHAFTNKIQVKLYSQTHIKYDKILLNSILSIPQPDLMVKSEVGNLIGENQYTNNLNFTNGQFIIGRAFYGYRLQFNVKLQNENAIDDTIIMYYRRGDTNKGWKFDVYELDLTSGTNTNAGLINKTPFLANTNNSGYSLSPGETKDFLVRVEMADKDIDVSEVFKLIFYAKSKDNLSKMDVAGIEVIRQPVAVSGKVVYKETGQPIADATFTIWDANGENPKNYITDSDGKVSFEYLPGTYTIKVKSDDYIEYDGEISIEDAETYDFGSIELLKYNVEVNTLNIHTFPNPISEGDTVRFVYNVPKDDTVTIEIYDVMGRVIRVIKDKESIQKGRYTYLWDGLNDDGKRVTRGVYFLIISTSSENNKVKIFIK